MATTTAKLVFVFSKSDNTSTTMSFSHINPEIGSEQVGTLAQAIITNGSIYKNIPVALKSAKLVQTTETPYNV